MQAFLLLKWRKIKVVSSSFERSTFFGILLISLFLPMSGIKFPVSQYYIRSEYARLSDWHWIQQ